MLIIEIQNSKFDVKNKDASRLNRLSQEQDFSKILESKCDINYKIARVITNAVNWTVNLNAFKSGKMSIKIPAKKYTGGTAIVEAEEPKFIDIPQPAPKPADPSPALSPKETDREANESPGFKLPQLN